MNSSRTSGASAEDLLPDRLEEVVHRRAGTQMRVMLDGVAAGAGARGPVRFKDTVGEDRTLPDPDRVVSETRAAGADGIAVPALRLPQFGVQPQRAVAVSLLGIAPVAEGLVAHLRVEGGEGQVAQRMAEALPGLRPVGPELGLPRVRQGFALRHDVIDRIRTREARALCVRRSRAARAGLRSV